MATQYQKMEQNEEVKQDNSNVFDTRNAAKNVDLNFYDNKADDNHLNIENISDKTVNDDNINANDIKDNDDDDKTKDEDGDDVEIEPSDNVPLLVPSESRLSKCKRKCTCKCCKCTKTEVLLGMVYICMFGDWVGRIYVKWMELDLSEEKDADFYALIYELLGDFGWGLETFALAGTVYVVNKWNRNEIQSSISSLTTNVTAIPQKIKGVWKRNVNNDPYGNIDYDGNLPSRSASKTPKDRNGNGQQYEQSPALSQNQTIITTPAL